MSTVLSSPAAAAEADISMESVVSDMDDSPVQSPKSPIKPPEDPEPHPFAAFIPGSKTYETIKLVIEKTRVNSKTGLPDCMGELLGEGSYNAVYAIRPESQLGLALHEVSVRLADQLVIRRRTNDHNFDDDQSIIQALFNEPPDSRVKKLLPPVFTPYITMAETNYKCMLVARCYSVTSAAFKQLIDGKIITEEAVMQAMDQFAYFVNRLLFLKRYGGVYIPDMKPENVGFCVYLENLKPTVRLVCSDIEMVIPCNLNDTPWQKAAFVATWTTFRSNELGTVLNAIPNSSVVTAGTVVHTRDQMLEVIYRKMLKFVLPYCTCGLTLCTLIFIYAVIMRRSSKTPEANADFYRLAAAAAAYLKMDNTKDTNIHMSAFKFRYQELDQLFRMYQVVKLRYKSWHEKDNMMALRDTFFMIMAEFPKKSYTMLANFVDVSA